MAELEVDKGVSVVETFAETAARLLNDLGEEHSKEMGELSRLEQPVLDEAEAERLAGMIVAAETELDRVKEAAKLRVGRAQERVNGLRFVFQSKLEAYAKERLDKENAGKKRPKKSIVLDSAKLAFRHSEAKVETENVVALGQWAEVNLPDAIELRVVVTDYEALERWEVENKKLAPGRITADAVDRFYIQAP